jgi:cytoskeleton protein RodZ
LHVAALAVSMKVPVKKLEALEADRLDLLPDAVFVRALASSVCRTLKIDPAPVLERLPQTQTPRLGVQERGINAPFHASGEVRNLTLPDFLRKPVVLLVGALLVGAIVVMLLPESPEVDASIEAPPEAPVPPEQPLAAQPEPPLPAGAASNPLGVTGVASPVPALVPQPLAQTSSAAPAAISVLAPAAVSANFAQPTAAVPAPVADTAPAGLLVLRSRGDAWVEVVDANGVVRVRKILTAGESTTASGPLPLSVVVGRADATEVEIRGKAFSLDKIAKDNVARFEVK